MKKIISLVLAVSLLFTMFCSVSITPSAETTTSNVDVATLERIGVDSDKGISLSIATAEKGGFDVTFSNYKIQLFKTDGTVNTSVLWMKGGIAALKDSNGNGVILQGGSKYSINIVYDVTSVGTEDATYHPQIGLARNNHSSNVTQDNGTVLYTAKKHGTVGSYSLSHQVTPSGNQPLRLAFGGHGAITIKSITIKKVSQTFGQVENLDLTNVEPISVSSASYSNFKAATDTTPLSVDINANYAYNGTLFDGTNDWINSWTVMYLKTIIPLKYDADNYVVLNSAKTYKVSVTYKVTATTATEKKDYPEIGIVYNNGYTLTEDNGSKVIAAQRIAPADVNKEKTLTATIDASKLNGHPLRLAFTGKGSFEVSSITIQEYTNAVAVTYVNEGITTVDYAVVGSELPTPVKAGYTFMGWFDADGVKHTTVTGAKTITAAWLKNTNVDLTKAAKIEGTKATMTLDIPTDAASALGVTIMGFDGILMDKESGEVHTGKVYTAGAAVALKYSDDSYVGLKNTSKYLVNVNYDVTSIDTFDKVYHPQIAILYNSATTTEDNGQYILSAKKHSKTVDNASISCVINGVDAKALRLAFDGQGSFSIKSVTVTEIPADIAGLKTVKYTDSTYSTDVTVLAENGSAINDLPRTLLHNFGGWYNGEEKATTVSGDVTLTAKWFDRADVTMNGSTDVVDIVRIKKALADESTDLIYDIDRDNNVLATDATVLRKTLLGVDVILIEGNDIATYTVEAGAQASFMTARATETLVETIDRLSENSAKTSSDKKIVVGISNINENVLKTGALENLTGINGDVYGLDDYKIFLKDGNIYIEAGSDYATAFAVNQFVDFIKTYKLVLTGFELSGKYGGQKDLLDGYSYTWGDEFNSEFLNTDKWYLGTNINPGPYYERTSSYYLKNWNNGNWIDVENDSRMQDGVVTELNEEGNNYYLENGLLVMKTGKTDNGYYSTKINAKKSFTYGIMTARVKLATKNGACSTLWSRTVDDNGASVNEFDFVENFGADQIVPNLHTWVNYTDHTNHGDEIDKRETIYPDNGESLSDSFHEISLYWDEEKIVFYFDGVAYLEQDIASDPEKWEAFHKSTYMIMGISAPTGYYGTYNNGSTPGDILGDMIDSFSESLSVDYIRVFQK